MIASSQLFQNEISRSGALTKNTKESSKHVVQISLRTNMVTIPRKSKVSIVFGNFYGFSHLKHSEKVTILENIKFILYEIS